MAVLSHLVNRLARVALLLAVVSATSATPNYQKCSSWSVGYV